MNNVVYFELHSSNDEQSRTFFSNVFDWKFSLWPGEDSYWTIATGSRERPGIGGGLMKSRDGEPRTVSTVQVDDLDHHLNLVAEHGGVVVVPKMEIPGAGYLAYCKDPGGILFAMTQPFPPER